MIYILFYNISAFIVRISGRLVQAKMFLYKLTAFDHFTFEETYQFWKWKKSFIIKTSIKLTNALNSLVYYFL